MLFRIQIWSKTFKILHENWSVRRFLDKMSVILWYSSGNFRRKYREMFYSTIIFSNPRMRLVEIRKLMCSLQATKYLRECRKMPFSSFVLEYYWYFAVSDVKMDG